MHVCAYAQDFTCIIYSVSQVVSLLPTTHAQTRKSDKAMQLITEAAMEKLKAHVDTVVAVIIIVSKANTHDGPNPKRLTFSTCL